MLFDGKIGCYTGKKVHLELIDNFTPSWKRAYPELIKFPTTAEVETNAIEIRKYVMKIIF